MLHYAALQDPGAGMKANVFATTGDVKASGAERTGSFRSINGLSTTRLVELVLGSRTGRSSKVIRVRYQRDGPRVQCESQIVEADLAAQRAKVPCRVLRATATDQTPPMVPEPCTRVPWRLLPRHNTDASSLCSERRIAHRRHHCTKRNKRSQETSRCPPSLWGR
jgi:hypothetical protein